MSLKLVNTAPGDDTAPMKPGQDIFLGLRSTTLSVDLGTLSTEIALSSVQQGAVSPEADPHLSEIGASILFETPERVRPITGQSTRTFPGTGMLITKNSNNDGEQSIFEVKVPISSGNPALAHFKVRIKNAWQLFQPNWCYLPNMTGVYMGLEHGTFNTAAYVFLRKNGGVGSVVYGGPQSTPQSTRPSQTEVSYDWTTVGDNGLMEFFVFFNTFTSPFQIEIWAKKPTDISPTTIATVPYLTLGTFPNQSTHAENFRSGIDDHVTIFFGIPGKAGDQLQIDDWTLYPDYRLAINEGLANANNAYEVLPDLPLRFSSSDNLLPESSRPARWFPLITAPTPLGMTADAPFLIYQPGRRESASAVRIPKTVNGGTISYIRKEPRTSTLQDGVMVEALISGDGVRVGECLGGGLCIDDGAFQYKVIMVQTSIARSFGILKDVGNQADANSGYYLPLDNNGNLIPSDFRAAQIVRLALDRRRSVVELYAGDESNPILTVPISNTFPFTSGVSGVSFGHLSNLPTTGTVDVGFLNYLSTYLAWDGRDNKLPDDGSLDSGARFIAQTSDASGSVNISSGTLTITKAAFNTTNSKRQYSLSQSFDVRKGIQVDFRAKIDTYTSQSGEHFAPNTNVGSGIVLFLGTKKLALDFFDCGVYGRKVGFIPGSGSINDILNQTALGTLYSAPVDWSQDISYRLIVKPYDSIVLYTGSVVGIPALVIPWNLASGEFDFQDDITASSLVFGHFDQNTSSTTEWKYIRWGLSHGYDVAISQQYPNGYPSYLFGGKEFVYSSFDEV